MNIIKIQLPTITCNHSQSASILEIIIHTILFQRTIGMRVKPREIESYLFDDLVYVAIDDDTIINRIKHELIRICQTKEGNSLPIVLSLYYSIKRYGFLGEYYEKVEFERWSITLQHALHKTFVDEHKLQSEIQLTLHTILSNHDLPLQLPNHEQFSFMIVNSASKQSGLMYDMLESASRMFGTP